MMYLTILAHALAFARFVLPPLTAGLGVIPVAAAPTLAIILFAVPPLMAPLDARFLRSKRSALQKLAYYGVSIAYLWALAGAAVWIFGIERLSKAPWRSIDWLPSSPIADPLLGILAAAFFVLALMPLLQSFRGPRWRRAYAKATRRYAEAFPALLPDSAVERFGFALLGLTAGICEEVTYRGFLIHYLHDGTLALPLLAALAASSLAFGLGHLYQGIGGSLRTGLGGVAFGLLFLLSGSLIPGIVIHALMDIQLSYVLRPLPDLGAAPAPA